MTNDNPIKGSNAPKSEGPNEPTLQQANTALDAVSQIPNDFKTDQEVESERIANLLKVSRIKAGDPIKADEHLFAWSSVEFMPRQNIISLKAPAKAGKTFVLTAFSLAFLSGNYQGLTSYAKPTDTMLFVDTEQSRTDTQRVLKRIENKTNQVNRISVLNIRNVESKDRIAVIDMEVENLKPSLIVIDGIADLIAGMDYNDNEQADSIITHLSRLAEQYNAVVICAIHVNKNDNFATGWLGRLLLQKCALELSLTREGKATSRTLEPTAVRGREPLPISLEIIDTEDKLGEIRIISPIEAETAKAEKQKADQKTKLQDLGLSAGVYGREALYDILRKGYKQIKGADPSKAWCTNTVQRACKVNALRVDNDNYIFDE